MTNIAVLVSGGGTNLQAIIDSVADGSIRNVRICAVISNNKHAFALERARKAGIEALCVSPKDFASRVDFNEALLGSVQTLRKFSPKICAALYHKPYDYFLLPLMLNRINGDYRFYRRDFSV